MTGKGWRNASSLPRPHDEHARARAGCRRAPALGLAASDASLARNFTVATPTEQRRPMLVDHLAADAVGDLLARRRRGGGPRHVEERLVERDRLDERGARPQQVHDPGAHVAVVGVVAGRGTRRAGTAGGPGSTAWPSARRSAAPRSDAAATTPRSPVPPDHHRPGPAARVGAAARRTRRTRPCRRGGSTRRRPTARSTAVVHDAAQVEPGDLQARGSAPSIW